MDPGLEFKLAHPSAVLLVYMCIYPCYVHLLFFLLKLFVCPVCRVSVSVCFTFSLAVHCPTVPQFISF